MTVYLYHLFIRGYAYLMRLAAFFHPKARLWVEGRKGLMDRLSTDLPSLVNGRPVAWFHAASLGEFEQGRPVIEAFRIRYPDYFIFVTFFSPSGYEVRKNYAQADYVSYLPIDTHANARQLVELIKPRVTFFIKYEFWYNYLRQLRESGSVILSFSAIFRPSQLFFKSYGSFYRNLLGFFDYLLVQNEESAVLLHSIGLNNVKLAGDTRFDRVKQIADSARDLPEIADFVQSNPCLIIGSAWEADRAKLVPALNKMPSNLRIIIAPHEIREQELVNWEESLEGISLRYSVYKAANFDLGSFPSARYLLIDNIGMLSSLYRYGQVAYIGGAFGAGLHNILEAATFGLPILFGNTSYQKFQEAVDLQNLGGAWALADAAGFEQKLVDLLEFPSRRENAGVICRTYVKKNTGATAMVMKCVENYLR